MYNSYMPYGVSPYQQQQMQSRLNQMEQQYGTYQQNGGYAQNMMQTQPMVPQVLKGRPVSNMEEAKASMIDLDGSLFVFPDIANGKIYTKQVLMDGTADFKVYCLDGGKPERKASETKQIEFVPFDVFNDTVKELTEKIEFLKGALTYEPNASNDDKTNARK